MTWYEDADDDGLGNPDSSMEACEQPDGYVANSDDDDDTGDETDILVDFNEYFYGTVWVYHDGENNAVETYFGAEESGLDIEVITRPYNSDIASSSFSVDIDPDNDEQLIATSELMRSVFAFLDSPSAPYIISSITSDELTFEVNGNRYTFLNKETLEVCEAFKRLFEAEWLVANNDYTKDYLVRDSIRFIPTKRIIGQDIYVYGRIGNSEFPDGTGTNDDINSIVVENGCNVLYSSFPTDMFNDQSDGPHLFNFVQFEIVENDLIANDDDLGDLHFSIID